MIIVVILHIIINLGREMSTYSTDGNPSILCHTCSASLSRGNLGRQWRSIASIRQRLHVRWPAFNQYELRLQWP